MKLGVIADDFTGATDIAGFLVQNGLSTVQLNGVPAADYRVRADAVVISLKSRSCPPAKAVADALAALDWLRSRQCRQFYFKYCSTFDSTDKGNIGPVTDALLDALDEQLTVISPALPVNGRTVYQGYLFVHDQLLSESGMRNHPVTPMRDSNLLRVMEAQSRGRAGLVAAPVLDRGPAAVRERLARLRQEGVRYAVLDALHEQHLLTQGEALHDLALVTGGSGLAIGLARYLTGGRGSPARAQAAGAVQGERCVVLSGSCSVMTNAQVEYYRRRAPARTLEIEPYRQDPAGYIGELCDWVVSQERQALAPLLYATTSPENLGDIQRRYGAAASSETVEHIFSGLVRELSRRGYQRFIVAGGETAGVVVQTLGIAAFHIGPAISPGVPWVRAVDRPISLALKSGNFGDENFFEFAQTGFPL